MMWRSGCYLIIIVLMTFWWEPVCSVISVDQEKIVHGTELLMTYLVHRHGDKIPGKSVTKYDFNRPALAKYIDKYGRGALTNEGKRRAHHLGQYIRWRYNELLSWQYNQTEINIYSTDVSRTQMTCLTEMSAVYPPIDRWSDSINWVPTPYTTKPAKSDPMLAFGNCPIYKEVFVGILSTPTPKMDKYENLRRNVNKIYGENFELVPATFLFVYDTLVSEMSLGIDLGPELTALMPELRDAHSAVMELLMGNDESKRIHSGFLMFEFFRVADGVLDGSISQKVWIHSGHDVNVFGFMTVSQVATQGGPEYCSSFALELRRDRNTGQVYVLPVYLPSPEDSEMYLPVEGCGLLCDLEQFRNLTAKYRICEDEWKIYCECTPDFIVDCDVIP